MLFKKILLRITSVYLMALLVFFILLILSMTISNGGMFSNAEYKELLTEAEKGIWKVAAIAVYISIGLFAGILLNRKIEEYSNLKFFGFFILYFMVFVFPTIFKVVDSFVPPQ